MYLQRLYIKNFRNIVSQTIVPSDRLNLIYGVNGSGKTSIIESIFFLGHLRSFRTNKSKYIITQNKREFVLYAEVNDNNTCSTIGIKKDIDCNFYEIKLNKKNIKSASYVASCLPIQIIYPNTYKLLESSSSKERRCFIDWGLFHVKQSSFFLLWKRLNTLIKQRNSALRRGKFLLQKTTEIKKNISVWDNELILLSDRIDKMRRSYCFQLLPEFYNILLKLTDLEKITFDYYRGWNKNHSIRDELDKSFERDLKCGFTNKGPHKADLVVNINNIKANDILSRGQIKLIVSALKISQGFLYEKKTSNKCVYLIDDLQSELDLQHQKSFFDILTKTKNQIFVTINQKEDFFKKYKSIGLKMFHVEHGFFKENN